MSNTPDTPAPSIALMTHGMKWLLRVATVLVLIAGIQLFVQTEYTDTFFAWTIAPPKNLFITATFLGAGYWSSCAMEWLSSQEPVWARARIAVISAFVFSTLTLIATLLHLNLFHFNSTNSITLTATWAWMIVYVVVPPIILGLLIQQNAVSGDDPPRSMALPGWIRQVLLIQGIIMLVLGAMLFAAPHMASILWPWALTPLTARAIASWLLGMSAAALLCLWENDVSRTWRAATSFAVFGLLNLIGLIRYSYEISWSLSLGLYCVFWVMAIASGVKVLSMAHRQGMTASKR